MRCPEEPLLIHNSNEYSSHKAVCELEDIYAVLQCFSSHLIPKEKQWLKLIKFWPSELLQFVHHQPTVNLSIKAHDFGTMQQMCWSQPQIKGECQPQIMIVSIHSHSQTVLTLQKLRSGLEWSRAAPGSWQEGPDRSSVCAPAVSGVEAAAEKTSEPQPTKRYKRPVLQPQQKRYKGADENHNNFLNNLEDD